MLVVGGLASILHGASLITNDLDICYRRSKKNLEALVQALTAFQPMLRGPKGEGISFLFDAKTLQNGMNFTLKTEQGDIDLLGELSGVGNYEMLNRSALKTELFGIPIKVISLEDLIRAKRAAGRKKDLVHLDELEALKLMTEKKLTP